ncbi:DUF4231 domain-containing protein [Streptomyces sp. NPDC005180]|uniref:DUF4231 domain-containing protein n=1 Tax=Streptomyces sp. NPDC005180 TaxID=3156868 RepID=UPI0033BE85C1
MPISPQDTPLPEVRALISDLQRKVREGKGDLAWKKRRARWFGTALLLIVLSVPALVAWSALHAEDQTLLVAGNGALVSVLVVSAVIVLGTLIIHGWKKSYTAIGGITVEGPARYSLSRSELQERLLSNQESLRQLSALVQAPLRERRGLYREDVVEVVAQYQREGRKYRRVHNAIQSLVMVGSTAMTTLAALEAKEWNWQTISVISLGFCVTLASAFTGYYKYRERSYFLRQTADAIEEEVNALSLGVGEYQQFGPEQEDVALALFTQRVEALRNEQRRREQQLDQPAEHAPVQGSAGV